MKNKTSYAVDRSNRLIVMRKDKSMPVDGKFVIDKDNRLAYLLDEPANWRRQYGLPSKINLAGNWKLNQNYDLELNLKGTKNQYEDNRLILKGEIISTDLDALVFEMRIQDKRGLSHIRLLKLSGSWKADEFNRLTFMVKKNIALGIMTLEGAWQINQNQQITYSYEKADLKTKTKVSKTFVFTGFWQIKGSSRLAYILLHSNKSRFDFRVQIESPNLYPKEGVIKYRIGIGLRQEKALRPKVISLYGTWKFSRKLGLTFQMDYGNGRLKSIEFGTDIDLSKKDTLNLSLNNSSGEPLGFNIGFTHKFLKQHDAETFMRLSKLEKEYRVEAGVGIPF